MQNIESEEKNTSGGVVTATTESSTFHTSTTGLSSAVSPPLYIENLANDSSTLTTSESYTVTTTTETKNTITETTETSIVDDKESLVKATVTEEGTDISALHSKVQIESSRVLSYGPTYKEESAAMQEEIYLTETYTDTSSKDNNVNKRNSFFSRFQRRASNTTTLVDEEVGKTEKEMIFGTPPKKSLLYRQFFGDGKYPVTTFMLGLAMISYFIYEIVKNRQLSGDAIQTNPFNPLIGPNYAALITMKSKFTPCMRASSKYPPSYQLGNCYSLNSTCTIETACGGFDGAAPNQTSRFITAMFVHAGVVHLLLNLFTHFHLGNQIERTLGLVRFAFLYIGSGVWGFILSATVSGSLSSSMGCSGALFGLLGYEIVQAVITWKDVRHPYSRFLRLTFATLVSLAIGLLPGFDNFAHIGGLVMGILLSILLSSSSRPFASRAATICTWVSRVIALIAIIALYVVFLRVFFTAEDLDAICPNCKHFSCIPSSGWCDV